MKVLFKNIKQLLQIRDVHEVKISGSDMKELPCISNAYLLVENGFIKAFGEMAQCPTLDAEVVDATGKMLLPSWCDSHTHIVYAGNREGEFVERIKGASYEEIAANGGGILNSAKQLQSLPEDELYAQSATRLEEVISLGTGAIEIKSGYGLTVDAELKMLRVIKRLTADYTIPIRSTFLAAHALPAEFKSDRKAFLESMTGEILEVIKKEQLAQYIDVFCETGYFSVEEMVDVLMAGREFGLIPKVHVNQFTAIGGVKAAVDLDALSVDHLELLNSDDLEALKGSDTMPVALPGCSYFLGIPYTPARDIIDTGLPLALATDYNPGSTPSGNMNFAVSSACIKMGMTPEEAINAATLNGAYAMGLEEEVGSITVGKRANLILTKPINSYGVLPYAYGSNLIEQVYVNGKPWIN